MINWLLPAPDTRESAAPTDSQIIEALEALAAVTQPEALEHTLQQQAPILLAEPTFITLCLTSAREYVSGSVEVADQLQDYLGLLEYACRNGIVEAYRYAIESDEETPADAPIPDARKLELSTLALSQIDVAQYPLVCAELRLQRANTFMQDFSGGDEYTEKAIADYDTALTLFTPNETPLKWVQAHLRRGLAYTERAIGAIEDNIERAIIDFNQALQVISRQEMANEWIAGYTLRGLCYLARKRGDEEDNLAQAIADFDTALLEITRETLPSEWVELMLYRIDAIKRQKSGLEESEKIERAIVDYSTVLEVLTRESNPEKWSQVRANRGLAYIDRTYGERAQNIAHALEDFHACLPLLDRNTYEWALIHMHRGFALLETLQGDHIKNVKQAILDSNAALTVFSPETTAEEWAITHMNRGLAYHEIAENGQPIYYELALDEQNTALKALSRDTAPENWAMVHMNRGLIYTDRVHGDRAENIERAIEDHRMALEIFDREKVPRLWVQACLNLGYAYIERIRRNRRENIEQAIAILTKALEVADAQTMSYEWALIYLNRASAYTSRLEGERIRNLEQAVSDADQAITIFTREARPLDWAKAGLNRTLAYAELMRNHHRENLDYGINDLNAILEVLTPEISPRPWGLARMNRGIAYMDRSLGSEAENLEQAIEDFDAALTVFTPEKWFSDWVLVRLNRGLTYTKRIEGESVRNLALAMADFNEVLAILTKEQIPYLWAIAHRNRGNAYTDLPSGQKETNLRQALADYDAALTICTRAAFPRDYRDLQLNKANAYQQLGQWQQAQAAAQEAREVTRQLVEAASTEANRSEVIGERDTTDVHLREVEILLHSRTPDLAAAACILEESRAQSLRIMLDLDTLIPEQITDPAARTRVEAFVAARDAWLQAQRLLTNAQFLNLSLQERYAESKRRIPQVNAAHAVFIQARDAIRQYDDLDFLVSSTTIEKIGQALPSTESALVYLVSREEMGFALVVMKSPGGKPEVKYLPLPRLTRKALIDLLLHTETMPPLKLMLTLGGASEVPLLTGGYWMAQLGQAFEFLLVWGDTIREVSQVLPSGSPYLKALLQLIYSWAKDPEKRELLNRPLVTFGIEDRLALGKVFSNILLNIELKRCLPALGELGLTDVAWALETWGIQDVTLIPFGKLGLFPLPAAQVRDKQGQKQTFGKMFITTIAPSARAKEIAIQRASQLERSKRPLLLTVGNPQPLPRGASDLVFAEAEAATVRRIARGQQYPPESIRYLRLREATRQRVIEALEQAWYAHMAVHGEFNIADPRGSRLVMAGDEVLAEEERSIYLREALDGSVNLKGLRLLVLSGCETGVIDASLATDEALALGTGFLQAGAAGVIASLWAVDDRATYLLMSRFAQLYLDPQRGWPPARALAEAQRWLREEATNKVLATYDPAQHIPLPSTPATADEKSIIQEAKRSSKPDPGRSTIRSLRYTQASALGEIRVQAAHRSIDDPHALPYADPIYWAAFVVTGC